MDLDETVTELRSADAQGTDAPTLSISAVLPCFEEAPNLVQVVDKLTRALESCADGRYEIVLVVSEAARDGTPALASALAAGRPALRVVRQRADDAGYGRALALGIAAATRPWLLLTDADGQFDHSELPGLIGAARSADMVLGYRAARRDAPARRLAGALYSTVVGRAIGARGLHDIDCAFKLLRADAAGPAPLRCRTGAVNAELIARARDRGARIAQVAVTHLERRAGRGRFEARFGVLGAVPRPREALAIVRDVAALAAHRFMAGSDRQQRRDNGGPA